VFSALGIIHFTAYFRVVVVGSICRHYIALRLMNANWDPLYETVFLPYCSL